MRSLRSKIQGSELDRDLHREVEAAKRSIERAIRVCAAARKTRGDAARRANRIAHNLSRAREVLVGLRRLSPVVRDEEAEDRTRRPGRGEVRPVAEAVPPPPDDFDGNDGPVGDDEGGD